MEGYSVRILESAVVLLSYVIIKSASARSIDKVAIKFAYQKQRTKIIKKLINTLTFLLLLGFLLFIWGVDQSELVIFISSLLAILGVAFVAQWSMISNIT